MMNKKTIIWSVAAILVLGLGYYWYTTTKTQAIAWKTDTVQNGNIAVLVTATGSINPDTTVLVGTQVSGIISKLYADWNSVVKKGQLIALIDPTFLEAAKNEAVTSQQKASIQVNQMKTEFMRAKLLYDEKVLARMDYDLALSNYKSAQSLYKSAVLLVNKAKINLGYTRITAPIGGTIISKSVEIGQTVVASFNTPTLFTIANDLTKMQVQANVDEADIGEVKVGQEATFTVDAFPNQNFSGKIRQIRLSPNVIQNVVNYAVIIDAPNKDLKLVPGLTANINIIVKQHENVLKVPSNALHFIPPVAYFENDKTVPDSIKEQFKNARTSSLSEGDIAYIWVKEGKNIAPKKVKVGLSDGAFTEITGNIKQNDVVIMGVSKDKTTETATKSPFMPSIPKGTQRGTK